MEQQSDPERVWRGWTERAYASVPLSPAVVGAAIAGVLVLAFGVSEFALGRHLLLRDLEDPSRLLTAARITAVNCLLAAYLPTAYIYLLRGYRGTLGQMRSELDWCRDALIRERTKLREGGAERSRIEEIVAYRNVVEGVSTWPADSSTFVRILLYLLIPLGSWAGGAIVERFVDSVLG